MEEVSLWKTSSTGKKFNTQGPLSLSQNHPDWWISMCLKNKHRKLCATVAIKEKKIIMEKSD